MFEDEMLDIINVQSHVQEGKIKNITQFNCIFSISFWSVDFWSDYKLSNEAIDYNRVRKKN